MRGSRFSKASKAVHGVFVCALLSCGLAVASEKLLAHRAIPMHHSGVGYTN